MMPRPLAALAALAGALLLTGCSTADLATSGHRLADGLDSAVAAREAAPAAFGPVLVTSFADIDRLDRSSAYGRMAAETVASRLVERGWEIKEARMMNGFATTPQGEFALSREAKRLARGVAARSVLVGTYAVGDGVVYVNARLIDIASGTVVAAVDERIAVDEDDRPLLQRAPGWRNGR